MLRILAVIIAISSFACTTTYAAETPIKNGKQLSQRPKPLCDGRGYACGRSYPGVVCCRGCYIPPGNSNGECQ
jgi:hypothetical protein